MGYCMYLKSADFTIKAENADKALQVIKALEGSYKWVDTYDYKYAETLSEAFEGWRCPLRRADGSTTGDYTELRFSGEKDGVDLVLWEAVAPYVEPGSYIEMQGEDRAVWRWEFDGETVRYVEIPAW